MVLGAPSFAFDRVLVAHPSLFSLTLFSLAEPLEFPGLGLAIFCLTRLFPGPLSSPLATWRRVGLRYVLTSRSRPHLRVYQPEHSCLFRAAPLYAIGPSWCVSAVFSAWPLAVSPFLSLLLRAASLCALACKGRITLPLFGRRLYALLARPAFLLVLSVPLCRFSCSLYCSVLGMAFCSLSFFGPHSCALLARRGAFLLFSRHDLWPFLLSLAPLSSLSAVGLSCSSFALSSAPPYLYNCRIRDAFQWSRTV